MVGRDAVEPQRTSSERRVALSTTIDAPPLRLFTLRLDGVSPYHKWPLALSEPAR